MYPLPDAARQFKPPLHANGLDLTHPATRDLLLFAPMWEGDDTPWNVVEMARATLSSGSALAWAPTPLGWGRQCPDVNNTASDGWSLRASASVQAVSLEAWMVFDGFPGVGTTPANAQSRSPLLNLNTSSNTTLLLGNNAFGIAANQLAFRCNGQVFAGPSGTLLNAGEVYQIGAVCDGANLKLILNGQVLSTTAYSGGAGTFTGVNLFRDPANSTAGTFGRCLLARVWGRALANEEWGPLYQRPWEMLAAPEPWRLTLPAVSTYPAYYRQYILSRRSA